MKEFFGVMCIGNLVLLYVFWLAHIPFEVMFYAGVIIGLLYIGTESK